MEEMVKVVNLARKIKREGGREENMNNIITK